MVRTSTVARVQCAVCIGDLPPTFVTVGSYRSQSPEHDNLSEVGSVATNLAPSQPEKDPSLPVKGMYPLLDLITEQGSSGLGKSRFCFVSLEPTLRTSQWTRLSSPNNLFK